MNGRLSAFPPVCADCAHTLILGTFPSPASRGVRQYYGNPRNQFWRIFFESFGLPFDSPDYALRTDALTGRGFALWDVLTGCECVGALDSDIRSPEYNTAIPGLILRLGVRRVLFNGGNAQRFYRRGIGATNGLCLPSTSPANARHSYAKKLELWRAALTCPPSGFGDVYCV